MSTIKLTPKNLPAIQKHFKDSKKLVENKLYQARKKVSLLEKELETLKDGEEWCENVYEAHKGK